MSFVLGEKLPYEREPVFLLRTYLTDELLVLLKEPRRVVRRVQLRIKLYLLPRTIVNPRTTSD